MNLQGKRIILTGATGGVGRYLAKMLFERGATLLLISRNNQKLKSLRKSLIDYQSTNRVAIMAADFSDVRAEKSVISNIRKRFSQGVDILINNAGLAYHAKITSIKRQELVEVFSVNALMPIILTSKLLPLIAKSSHGQIINISSILGSRAMERTASYTASKHALSGFSKVLRLETAHQGIRVTTVEPGAIETPFILRTHNLEAKRYFARRKLVKIPPATIAEWVLHIIESDAAACPEVVQIMPQGQTA